MLIKIGISLEDAKTLVTQNYIVHDPNYVGKKKINFENEGCRISKTIAAKINWIRLKKLFRRKKQNLQEIKIKV